MTVPVVIIVNGDPIKWDVPDAMLLVEFLREVAGSSGTLVGCDTAQCGCCTVLLDGDAVKACSILAAQADGYSVKTVEGLAIGGQLHPMQLAFQTHHALQCGYCTGGMLMNAIDIVAKHDRLDDAKVRRLLEGNICRCTGYGTIADAILSVANGEPPR